MLDTYRRVLALPGALAFSLSGLLARLPISMVSLGIVLLVSARTGSYSLAGSVSASYILANALVAIVQGRLTDRFGQRTVLPAGALVFSAALGVLMWSVETGRDPAITYVAAFLAGASIPVVGSAVRARWAHLVPDKTQLQTAFAYEAVMDEVVFMVGPTLVTLLATAVHPLAGLGTAVAAGAVGTVLFAAPDSHRRHKVWIRTAVPAANDAVRIELNLEIDGRATRAHRAVEVTRNTLPAEDDLTRRLRHIDAGIRAF